MRILNYVCIGFISAIRPILGPACCKFPISCTDFAFRQLQTKSFFGALRTIFFRIIRCNPFNNNLLNDMLD